jgi:hypothetical protein
VYIEGFQDHITLITCRVNAIKGKSEDCLQPSAHIWGHNSNIICHEKIKEMSERMKILYEKDPKGNYVDISFTTRTFPADCNV